MMRELTITQFQALTDIPPETIKSLARRGQLPFSIDQKSTGRGYTLFEAFLTVVFQEFRDGHGIRATLAAHLASALPDALASKWDRIVQTAQALAAGDQKPMPLIMCGQFWTWENPTPQPVAGTILEISQSLRAADQQPDGMICSSASQCLADLIVRAREAGVKIPEEFWSPPFRYRPAQPASS